ncbi:hypothetical protein LXA43DRAFT_228709 [Ganoderma leucocontextum]|nr:hypothetical protein LXA43DRAFT_228709 [Ganoderma leucocontextum]
MLSANYTYNWGSERHALTGHRYGHEGFIELRQALLDFIEANYWAFHMLSKALAVLEDGFTSGAQTPLTILNITLRLAQDSRMLNPSCSFTIRNYRWMSLDEFKSNAKEYEQ